MADTSLSKQMSTSRGGRLLKLGSVAAGLVRDAAGAALVRDAAGAALETGSKVSNAFHERAARRLEKSLGEMKGLPMKLGQMLSYVDDMVPEAQRHIYRKALGKLQANTSAHPWSEMKAVLETELGGSVASFFADFETEAASAASIGQVYRATLKDGQSVAVKIQYPGVRKAIESDMKNINSLISALSFALPRVDVESTVHEVTARLLEECDYILEMKNQRTFFELWQGDPTLFVPEPIEALCRPRVLVSSWVQGNSWQKMMATSNAESRSQYGEALFRFVFTSLNRHGLFNADPHPGNFLFTTDGRIACLDYGCVQKFSPPSVRLLVKSRDAILGDKRDQGLHDLIVEAYGVGTTFNAAMWKAVEDYLLLCLEPLHAPQPFQFRREYTRRLFEQTSKSKLTLFKHGLRQGLAAANRPGVVFLGRIQMGLYSLLTDLEAQADWAKLLRDIDQV